MVIGASHAASQAIEHSSERAALVELASQDFDPHGTLTGRTGDFVHNHAKMHAVDSWLWWRCQQGLLPNPLALLPLLKEVPTSPAEFKQVLRFEAAMTFAPTGCQAGASGDLLVKHKAA